jgi:hypothetical protein
MVMWYHRLLANMLRRIQHEVTRRFPADEAERRNAELDRMIDVLLRNGDRD